MDAQTTESPRRQGRPGRDDMTGAQRRRRQAGGSGNKLAIPQEIIDRHPDMEFRWVKDDEGRVQQLTTADDWDAVPGVEPIHGGPGSNGTAIKLHLHMKPKTFMEEDRAEKLRALDELEKAQLSRPEAQQAIEQGAEMYSVPGNKLNKL